MHSFRLAGTQELRGVRVGLGESWARLLEKGYAGPRGASERASGVPEWRGVSSQLGFAVRSYRLPAVQ